MSTPEVTEEIVGQRKAAVALVGLGPERAAEVLKKLEEHEVRALMAEVVALGPVSSDDIRSVLGELASGLEDMATLPPPGQRYAREVLNKALGVERAEVMLGEVNKPAPFAWLADADPDVAAAALSSEPPAAIALALSHLDSKSAARLLTRLPEDLRYLVATRIAELTTVHAETVEEVDSGLQARVGNALRAPVARLAGPSVLAGVLGYSTREDEKLTLSELSASSPELAEQVRAELFTFNDLVRLDSRALQRILSAVEIKDVAIALRGAEEALTQRVFSNVSERARENLQEEIEILGVVRGSDIAEARARLVAVARQLEEEGTITIERAEDSVL